MKQNLQLTTSQQLSLTPQLKQSLEILQLSNIELERLIEQELVENPMLDREDVPATDQFEPNQSTLEAAGQENDWQPSDVLSQTRSRGNSNELNINPIEQTIANHESLREYLLAQIRLTTLGERDQFIAEALIYSIDKEGYLTAGVDEIAALLPSELEIETEEISVVLSLIKTLDPIGVGATDLRERLILLLDFEPAEASTKAQGSRKIASELVKKYLPLLANKNFSQLEKKLDASREQLTAAVAIITGLNPRVGNRFADIQKNNLTPDVIVSRMGSNWVAKLNSRLQQKLNVNGTYLNLLQVSKDSESSEFLEQHLGKARNFMKAVGSRYDTLLAVARVITTHQQAFFNQGDQHLRAMVMSDIASELGMHESTVSRAVSGKYLQCPQGVFELKYFFTSSVKSTSGTQASSTVIRSLIKKFISSESNTKPLSDSKLVKELEANGHLVARRTVAKYRESLNIPASSKRKML